MRDFFAFCTLMACLVVFVSAIVALFRPLPAMKMGTRKRALSGIGVAFLLFVLTAIIIPTPTKENPRVDKVAAKSGGAEASAEKVATPEQKELAVTFYKSIFAGLKGCDTAANETAQVVERMQNGQGTVYDGYSAATKQVGACRDSWRELDGLKIPEGLVEAAADAASKAKETCANTALAKQLAGKTAQEVFDGNTKPSKIEELKQRAETAQTGVMACAAGSMVVAMESGIELEELPKID